MTTWAGKDPMVIAGAWQLPTLPGFPPVYVARVLRDGEWTCQTIDREDFERLRDELDEAVAHLVEMGVAQ